MSASEHLSEDQFHSFDVEVSTHDLLRKGVVAARLPGESITHHRVNISAEYSHAEAQQIAALMRLRTASGHPQVKRGTKVMPTATWSRV